LNISVNAIALAALSASMLRAGYKDAPEKLQALKDRHTSVCTGIQEDEPFLWKQSLIKMKVVSLVLL